MSILTGFKKVKNYILTSSGYQLLSRWTSSQTVEFDDGKTAQAKLGEINGIAKTYVDMKKATDNSMAASAKAVMEGLENSSALISMTQAEYDALSDEERTDNNMRAILDANPDVVDAKNVNFDNTDTNLTATNTQSAITELNGKLDNKNNFIIKSSENEKLNADVVIIKHNKMIQIRFDGFKNLTLNTYNTLFVLPDEFKPVSGAFYDCSNPNGEIYRIVISSNGVVELFPYTNINLYNACNTFVYISN